MYNPTRLAHNRSKKRDPNQNHRSTLPIQSSHFKKRILIQRQFSTNQNVKISPNHMIPNTSSPFNPRNQTVLQHDSNNGIITNNPIVILNSNSTFQSPTQSIQDSLFSTSLNTTHSTNQSIHAYQCTTQRTKLTSPISTQSRRFTTSRRHIHLNRHSQPINTIKHQHNNNTIINHISKRSFAVGDSPRMRHDPFDVWPSDELMKRPKSNEDIFKRLPDQFYLQKIRNFHHFKAKLTENYPDWYLEPTLAPLLASTLGTIEYQLDDIGLILRELNKTNKFFHAHLRQQLHWCTIECEEDLNDRRLNYALDKILENYGEPDEVADWLTLPCQKLTTIATMLQRFYIYDKEPDEFGPNLHIVTNTILRIQPTYTWKEKLLMKLGWIDEPNYLHLYSRRADKDLEILRHFQSALVQNVYLPQQEKDLAQLQAERKQRYRKGKDPFEEIVPYEPDIIDKQLFEAEHAYALSELKRVEDKLSRALHTTPEGLDELEKQLKQQRRLEAPNDQVKRPKVPPKKGKKKK